METRAPCAGAAPTSGANARLCGCHKGASFNNAATTVKVDTRLTMLHEERRRGKSRNSKHNQRGYTSRGDRRPMFTASTATTLSPRVKYKKEKEVDASAICKEQEESRYFKKDLLSKSRFFFCKTFLGSMGQRGRKTNKHRVLRNLVHYVSFYHAFSSNLPTGSFDPLLPPAAYSNGTS